MTHSSNSFLVFTLFFVNACTSSKIVQPEYIQTDTTKDILVSTQDGRLIRMYAGDYRVVQLDGTKRLRGKGRLFLNESRSEAKAFEGEIAFDDIKSLETTEKSVFYYSGPIVLAGAVLFVLVVLLALGGRGFGG